MSFFTWEKRITVRKRKRSIKSRKRVEFARALTHNRLAHFNQFYNFTYNKVFIRSQKTRWGSCSSKGNLNFNWKIIFLPAELADYLIVHELCHLGEFNHSERFWNLVKEILPEYKKLRKELKRIDMRNLI